MTFQEALQGAPAEVQQNRQPGLQALGIYSSCVQCSNPRNILGSVDLDKCLTRRYPNDPRWDFVVGYKTAQNKEVAVWIEVHDASRAGTADEVIIKLRWLNNWVSQHAPSLRKLTRKPYYWLAPGKIAITASSPEAKKLAQHGLSLPRRRIELR